MSAACPQTPSPEKPSDGHLMARESGDDQEGQDRMEIDKDRGTNCGIGL